VRLVGCLPWLALLACAHSAPLARPVPAVVRSGASIAASVPESSAPAVPATAEAAPGPRRAALRYELNGRKFPLPLVHGTVEGEPVWMLVDTGANSHVIASWVARKVGLTMRPLGEVGSDHTGRAVTAYTVDRPRVVIDDWGPIVAGAMLVTDVPEPIARIGIGAFVSPQWLAGERDALVLDLSAGEMRSARWDEATRELDDHGGREIAPAGARLCEDSASAIRGLAFVIPASIEGRGVELLLDTGAHRTDLLSTSKTGRALAGRARPSREQMYAASGLVRTSVIHAAQVRMGDWSMTTDVDIVPGVADPMCPRDGVIAMDALETCTLVLARKRMRGRCGF
jgi:predicted aspartyl protease